MKIDDLQWDDKNVEHLAIHSVAPQEAMDICFGFHVAEKEDGQRYILSGQTEGGRYINVVIEKIGKGLFRPISAFEMSESYKRRYKNRFKK